MITIQSPYVQFTDLDGSPLDDGAVYIGTAGLNPQTNPITVYWDNAGTQPAAQPLTTRSGVIARNGAPARVYVNASAYSIMVRDKRGNLIAYESSVSSAVGTDNIDDGAITEVKLATAVATKINGALQKSGGTMTGAITLAANAANALEPVSLQQLQTFAIGKNRVINGAFTLNQRAFAGGTRTAGVYGHDMWKAGLGGATYTVTGETADITAGTLMQVIEGVNVPEGGTYTLSWSGTAQARVDSGSYAASPITVTGKTAGSNTTIEFGTGTVTKVQYESGATVTNFERRLYQQELAAAQRYYLAMTGRVINVAGVAGSAGQYSYAHVHLPVEMRAAPTVGYGITSNTNVSTAAPQDSSKWGCTLTITAASAGQFSINFTTLSFDASI